MQTHGGAECEGVTLDRPLRAAAGELINTVPFDVLSDTVCPLVLWRMIYGNGRFLGITTVGEDTGPWRAVCVAQEWGRQNHSIRVYEVENRGESDTSLTFWWES